MSITSTKTAVAKLGYKNWKTLQTCGYAALFFTLLHFLILESKPDVGFDVRPYGSLFFYIGIVALVLRLAVIFLQVPERKAYEEHMGESK